MKVIDLTAPRHELRVRIDPSPAYDFLACLYLLEHSEEGRGFEVSPDWVEGARRALGADLQADLALFFPRFGPTLGLVGVLEHTQGLSVRKFIRRIQSTPAEALLELMLAGALPDRQALPLLRAAIGGSRDAVEAFLAATHSEADVDSLRRLAALSPSEAKSRLVRLLREGYARVYAGEEDRVVPLLEQSAAALARKGAVSGSTELVEQATGGFVLQPGAASAGVVLAPTYFFRPYNLVTSYLGVRVFIYPIEPPHAGGVPPDLLRLYKALGDETRLRVLRLLSGRDMYLQELAKTLGVSHVTVLHHMAMLRAAHLVQVIERDNLKHYRLRAERAQEAAAEWLEFVKG